MAFWASVFSLSSLLCFYAVINRLGSLLLFVVLAGALLDGKDPLYVLLYDLLVVPVISLRLAELSV